MYRKAITLLLLLNLTFMCSYLCMLVIQKENILVYKKKNQVIEIPYAYHPEIKGLVLCGGYFDYHWIFGTFFFVK